MVKRIILIGGKKGSGKDYIADRLLATLPNAKILHIADSLKRFVCRWGDFYLNDIEELKNRDEVKIPVGTNTKNMRQILQDTGTELKKVFGQDIFIRHTIQEIQKSSATHIIIPDFRFQVELDELAKYYSLIDHIRTVKVFNNNVKHTDTHISENQLNDFQYNYNYDNTTRDPKQFKENLDKLVLYLTAERKNTFTQSVYN